MTEYSEDELNAIVLDSFSALTYKCKYECTQSFSYSSPSQKFDDEIIKSVGEDIYNKIREDFYSPSYRSGVLARLEKLGIRCVTYFSEDYPESFKNIPAPPFVLYCRGNVKLLHSRCFGVVGSRRTLANILKECSKISSQLAQKFTIVTGTASGADTAAAQGALEGGNLIFFAAQGLGHIYPAGSGKLYKMAAERGLVITEQRPEVAARAYLFPVRNRLIAALAEGVLVVSAGQKSGASITAEYAFEYGRDVFCFPYSLGVPSGKGCNNLIKKGAYLTESAADIFSQYGISLKAQEAVSLTEREKHVLSALEKRGEAHIQQIADDLGCNAYELLSDLSSLEVKGLICRLGGNRYCALT